jgi:uncharacterized protein (DUF58 family)
MFDSPIHTSPGAPLLSLSELTALHQQVLQRRARRQAGAGTILPGPQPSSRRGAGLELMETRGYQHGDDLRHLDWRATARSGKPMTKVFRVERQRSLFIALDRAASMAFGTQHALKSVTAARSAAILAFAAHHQHETVGGLIADASPTFVAPSRRRESMWSLVQAAAAPQNPCTTLWEHVAMWRPFSVTAPDTTIFVISDFLGLTDQTAAPLRELAQRRRVIALRIWDIGEQRLPRTAHLHLVDANGQHPLRIDTRSPALHAEFAQHVQARYAEILALLRNCGVVTVSLNSDTDPFVALEPWI